MTIFTPPPAPFRCYCHLMHNDGTDETCTYLADHPGPHSFEDYDA